MPDAEPLLADDAQLNNFERAFSFTRMPEFMCHCGKKYWDTFNAYDHEEGRREILEADQKAIGVPYSLDIILMDGREYVNACECWKPHASKIVGWLEANRSEVAKFLNLEKDRMIAEKSRLADVDE